MKIYIELDLSKARLVFNWRFSDLVINPSQCAGDSQGKVWPYCDGSSHKCKEHGSEVHHVPLSRIITDSSYNSDDRWFAFYEADCFDPPIYIVRAPSWEQAYEDFCETRPEVRLEDLDEDQRAMVEDREGNLPDGYSYTDSGKLVHTENIMGHEISLREVTP